MISLYAQNIWCYNKFITDNMKSKYIEFKIQNSSSAVKRGKKEGGKIANSNNLEVFF